MDNRLLQDVGILASKDLVVIEQAALDLLKNAQELMIQKLKNWG